MNTLGIVYILLSSSLHTVASYDHKLLYSEATEWYSNSLHYWPFEEVSNRTAKDYVGSNDGRINGGFNAVSGLVGSALELRGNETYVDFGVLPSSCLNRPATCRSGFTIAFWLKIPNFLGNKIVLQLGQHRFSRGFTLWTKRGLKKNVGFSVNTLYRKYDWVQDWYNDHWSHVALKWDNNTGILSIYLNCTIVKVINESEKATPVDDDKASRLILGASHAKRKNMRLMIDEFAIWNRTVSDDTLCKVFQIRSVNGNYSEWSKFSPCSVSCGNGTMKRIRNCTSPSPINRGRRCSTLGASEETKSCFLTECPTHGNYSEWSIFSNCSKTCGNGIKKRTRNCSNPKPKHEGRDCLNLGLGIEVKDCNTQPCPINGGYSKWTEFSQCSVSCGNGTRQRNRSCSNPQPRHDGTNCTHLGSGIEIETCNTNLCPIHGGFSEWTIFSKCTKSCGNGTQQRTRNCSNPKPKLGGRDCSSLGPNTDTRKCNTHHCPITGGFTQWTRFSHCSRTCGIGIMKRLRFCSNPKPKYGGSNCTHLGAAEDVKNCVLRRWCPVQGGFTEWSKFSECTRSCGVGIKNRTRYCTNPVPMHGGKDCTGIAIDFKVCNWDPCPKDGSYSPWSKFSTCTRTCANGTMTRTRNCSKPAPKFNGKNCSFLGPSIEIRNCNSFPCPVDGNYSSWSNFSVCSKSCGNGTMEKSRTCSSPTPRHGGKNCSLLGPSKEIRECNLFPCPVHGNFSSWSIFTVCSKSCGNGSKTRTRNCSNPTPEHGGENCSLIGPLREVRSCNVFPCPIHGNYSSWSNFSVCSQSCGNGTMTRYRNCTEPEPRYSGDDCSSFGPSVDIRSCNVFPCPVDGGYSSWGNFTQCTLSCGIGTMYRTRNCSNPVPQFGGKNCSKIGPEMEVKTCNERPCPEDGGYTSWSEFSQCSKSCGNGTAQRTRQCSNPVPQFGGHNCSKLGSDIDFQQCYLRPCPIDGGYGEWSNYTECTQSCNGGTRKRSRQCDHPAPKHGGRNCSSLGPETDEQPCNKFPCPIHGGYSEWTGFESCTRTCGGGMLIRRRNCTNPPPAHGGRDCSNLGPSMDSIECNTQKCPDIVFKVTVNLTSEKWDKSLATEKSNWKTNSLIWKIESGVRDIMDEKAVSAVRNFSFRQGSVIVDFSISLLHRYYYGITRLQDAINVEGKIADTLPVSLVNLTSPDVPVMAPRSITAVNISSTAILLTWLPIPSPFSNGRIVEYRVTYSKAENMDVTLRAQFSWQTVIDGEKLSYNITGLERFTNYRFRMAGINRRGVGVDSEPIIARTDEDKPSSSPSIVKVSGNSSTTIYVEWSPIPQYLVHGILLGYHIHYSNLDPEGYGDVSTGSLPTGPANSSTFLKSLLKFTSYRVQVSAFTVKGDGPLSDAVIIRTEEDVPSKPPANVTGNNLTSTSIEVHWNSIPPRFTHGILLGYKVSFLATDLGNSRKWNESVVNQSTTSVVISNLRKYTTYMVSLEGLTSKGSGIESKCVEITTAEDKPDAFPENVTGFNKSSTSLFVEWQHIPRGHRNGILQGYRITYYPKTPYQAVKHKTVDSTRSSTTLSNLKKYTWYVIKVAGYTSKGLGPHPPRPLEIRTSEDVPSKPVIKLKARNTSHTSLLVEWSDIPSDSVHGILLGFRVLFWRSNESRETYVIRETAPDKSSVDLKDLWIYTKYKIQILGFTAAGEGAVSKELEVSTDEFTPSQSPINVQALNKTHPTKIVVRWDPIPDSFYVHGILRGYKVFYKAIAIANEELEEELETNQVTVSSSNLSAVLENLSAFTKYRIEVLAFTVKGDGVKSIPIKAETCNCHSSVFTNWWINPPYVDRPDSNKSGIITPILKESVYACCGNCTDHGTTRVDFDYTASGRPAKKSGLVQFKENFEENTELQFPVYGFMDQTRFSDNYGFVPFVQSPGLALIIIGDEKGTAATLLLKSLAFCFPILFLSVAMLWVSSLAIWFVETAYNERHFPRNILHGSWEAMWWAFASMTTLGYGDRIPKTPFGRLVCLSWILLGLVMLTCFNSTMTTLLTARILDKDVPLYGTKIAAIQNSSGYRMAIRKNARVNPNGKEYTNLQEVYGALTNREVKGMLIDAFTVGSKKHLFNRRDLRISKLLDNKAAYGVVLGGEAKKLQQCLQKYVSEQRSEISKIVEKNVESIEITPKSMSVERSGSLFDPQFPTYVRAVIVCVVLLCVLWLVGAKFEFAKKMGWIKFRRKGPSESYSLPRRVELMRHKEELKAEMSRIVAIFKINCSRRIQVLRQRHKKELLHLAKLKRQADNVVIRKGSLHRDSLFSFAFAMKTPELSNGSGRNGHTKRDSSLKHDYAEAETIV